MLGHLVALLPGERAGKELHHLGIGVEGGERGIVTLPPLPQEEALGFELDDCWHWLE